LFSWLSIEKAKIGKIQNSFDDLVLPRQHSLWNDQADLFCRLKIYDQIELRGLPHRQIASLCACCLMPIII
jgi:hypothetical protein